MNLTDALLKLATLTPQAERLWRQHMETEGVLIDPGTAVHVWLTLEHDTFYAEPPWSANWVYFDAQGRITSFLHANGQTPEAAATALLQRMG